MHVYIPNKTYIYVYVFVLVLLVTCTCFFVLVPLANFLIYYDFINIIFTSDFAQTYHLML